MITLLHISDLHFGAPYVAEVGARLLAKAAEMNPQVVVVSGDLTQRAKPREFAAARAFLDRLPAVPRVVVPGNHDVPLYRVWERLLTPHRLYRRHIDERLDTVLAVPGAVGNAPGAVFVGLNSTAPYRAISNGRLRDAQLGLCRRAFAAAAPDAARVVVLHHHLVPAPTYEKTELMHGARRALETLTELRVDLIMAGHLHRGYVGNSLDVYGGEDRDHGIIVAQCGTSTSRRGRGLEREKNAFNWIEIDTDTITVTHHLYFHDEADFLPLSRHLLARPGHGRLDDAR